MEKRSPAEADRPIPPPPTQPPLLVLYDTRDQPGVLRHEITETDIVRAHRAISRLFERDDVVRAWIVHAVQEVYKGDNNGPTPQARPT